MLEALMTGKQQLQFAVSAGCFPVACFRWIYFRTSRTFLFHCYYLILDFTCFATGCSFDLICDDGDSLYQHAPTVDRVIVWGTQFISLLFPLRLCGCMSAGTCVAIFHLGWFTEKGPHKSQEYTVFPTFYPSFYDLWGPFLGCQPKWKISRLVVNLYFAKVCGISMNFTTHLLTCHSFWRILLE